MFSILIPLYNGVEFLNESVKSVINQTNDQWELLIGVNGHPPNSNVFKQAQQYVSDRVRVFDLPLTDIQGKSQALNTLVKYAKYPYIVILDADDIWHPTKLDVQMEHVAAGYDVIGSRCIYFGDRLNGIIPQIPVGDITLYDFFQGNPVINSSAIIKRELAYWDSIFDGVEDYDLWLRLWKQGHRFWNCSQVLVKHRLHSESAFNAKGNGNQVPALLAKYR
jgi:glycosyltransferase involved in cell wall biosynthesis